MGSEAKRTLSGGKLASVEHLSGDVVVTVEGGGSVAFSARHDGDECRLVTSVDPRREGSGRRLMADAEGRTIVRVQRRGEQLSLHLDDGEIFHILAVENEDGCRVATREEREHGRGVSSLLDRALARIRG